MTWHRDHMLAGGDDSTPLASVLLKAQQIGADFNVSYLPAGFLKQAAPWSEPEFTVPVYETGEYEGRPKKQYIVRDDTNEVVGQHSSKYPERDAYRHNFDVLEQAFPNACESVQTWDNGGLCLVTQRIGEAVELPMGDEVVQYVYSTMSLNGTKRTATIPKAQRISCTNALGITLAIISSKATRNHDTRISFQAEVFEKSEVQLDVLVRMAQTFTDQNFTDRQFARLVESIVPRPEEDASTRANNTYNRTRSRMFNTWRKESEEYGDQNMWIAYNAIQGAEQHGVNANFKAEDEKGYDSGQKKSIFASLEGGTPLTDACQGYLEAELGKPELALV
mgnify:CR=1 FL=1